MKRLFITLLLVLLVVPAMAQKVTALSASTVYSIVDSVKVRLTAADTSTAWPWGYYKYFGYQYRTRRDSGTVNTMNIYIQITMNPARPRQWKTIDSVMAITDTTWSLPVRLYIPPCKAVRAIIKGGTGNHNTINWLDIFGGS